MNSLIRSLVLEVVQRPKLATIVRESFILRSLQSKQALLHFKDSQPRIRHFSDNDRTSGLGPGIRTTP